MIVALLGVLGGVLSMSFIPGNAEKYSNILKTDTPEFSQDIQEVNYPRFPSSIAIRPSFWAIARWAPSPSTSASSRSPRCTARSTTRARLCA